MAEDPPDTTRADPAAQGATAKGPGGGLVLLGMIAFALILAISYFLILSPRQQDAQVNAPVGHVAANAANGIQQVR